MWTSVNVASSQSSLELSQDSKLFEHLRQFVSSERLQKIDAVLEKRTRHISVLLENIYQPHNASAVLRSCECFGIQDIHILEENHKFKPSSDVALGSEQWVNVHRYRAPDHDIKSVLATLKKQDYQIAVTTLSGDSRPIQDISLEKKTVLCFGTELSGATAELEALADQKVHIPMDGFTQSFNISVSVALCLYELSQRLKKSDISWELTESEKKQLKFEWVRKSIRQCDQIIKRYYQLS